MKGIILALGIGLTLLGTTNEASARNRNRGSYNNGYYPAYSSGSYYYPTYSSGYGTTYYTPNTTYYTPNTTYYTPSPSYYTPNTTYYSPYNSYPYNGTLYQQGLNWGGQQLLR